MTRPGSRKPSKKKVENLIFNGDGWNIRYGELKRSRGRPSGAQNLFDIIGEKLPYSCINSVEKHFKNIDSKTTGVYLAHDSMGYARYGGRGSVFSRLKSHKREHKTELLYFSFWIIENKNHEREIETAMIRSAGPQLTFNTRKKGTGSSPGDVQDYEPGTKFFERRPSSVG